MSQTRTHGVMRFERKNMRLILQSPDGRAENNPAQVVFKLRAIACGIVRRASPLGTDEPRPVHHVRKPSTGAAAAARRFLLLRGWRLPRQILKQEQAALSTHGKIRVA